MDVSSTIFSCIMNQCCFKILNHHGTKFQFSGTLNLGCQDGTFTLKTISHLCPQHNLPTYVTFIDLVNPFDTSNCQLLVSILWCSAKIQISSQTSLYRSQGYPKTWKRETRDPTISWSTTRRQYGSGLVSISYDCFC